MKIKYVGKSKSFRVRDRLMVEGDIISDPEAVKELKDHPAFEVVAEAAPKVESSTKQKKQKKPTEEPKVESEEISKE